MVKSSTSARQATPNLSQMLGASQEDRIAFIKRDRWISYDQAERTLRRLRMTLVGDRSIRPLCVLVWGPSNVGKSTILSRFLRELGGEGDFNVTEGIQERRVVSMECTEEADLGRVMDDLLTEIDPAMAYLSAQSPRLVRKRVYESLAESGAQILAIDNINNFTASRGNGQVVTLNGLRRMSSKLKIALVCMGTSAAFAVLRTDPQLLERFGFIELRPLDEKTEFPVFIRKLVDSYPLLQPRTLTSEMVDAVFSTSGGLIGRAVVQLREAAILSIEEDDQPLTLERLMDARVVEALASLPTSKQKR